MTRSVVRCVLVLLSVFSAGESAAQQWQIVSKPSAERLGVIYFLNEFTGFVGYREATGQFIAKTTDGGRTWSAHQLEFSAYSGDVSDILMVDNLNGWATCDATDATLTNRGLYRTSDGGLTWRSVQVLTDATSVTQVGQSVYLTSRRVVPPTPIMISRDGGTTWNASTPAYLNDLAFVDPQRGVACRYETASGTSGNWYRTTNGGNSWIAIPNMDESWSLYGEWGTPNFFAVPEDEPSAQNALTGSPVVRSTDYGQTWTKISQLNFHSTGHLAVASGNFYIQVSDRNPANPPRAGSGMFRSTNRGAVWVPIGGPTSDPDTRFSATGCKGGIVYASDKFGNLWKTRTGGDGTIIEPPFTLEFGSDTIKVSSLICENKTARFNFRNLYCSPDSIVSIELDQASPVTMSGAVSLANVPALPKVYQTDQGDYFDVVWDPSKLVSGDTTVYVKVRLRYYSTATKTLIDTSVVIEARAIGAAPSADIAPVLDMGNLPSCVTSDSLFTITNTGCDTLYIYDPSVPAGSGVFVTDASGGTATFPRAIPPGQSDTIYVRVNRTTPGNFITNLRLPADHQKIADTFVIGVRGNVRVTEAQFNIAFDSLKRQIDSILLDRGTMTRCDPPQEFYLYMSNPGCTEIAFRSVMFEANGIFSADAEGTLPDTLSGDDMHRVRITVTPNGLGPQTGRLRIRYKVGDNPSIDTFLNFTVSIDYGTRILSLEEKLYDLDTIEYCEIKDTVIRFQNTGCDTLTITDASFTGADFGHAGSNVLPRKVAPGAYDSVVVRYDPRLPGDALGEMTITSDADSLPTRTIDLRGNALPTDTVTFRLVPERDIVNSNDTLDFHLYPDTTIRGKGLRSLSLMLNYNGDVLTYMGIAPLVQGLTVTPPVQLQAGQKARQLSVSLFHATDIPLDSLLSLVAIAFRTTLSDSTYATMNLTDFSMNGGDPVFGKCVLGSKAKEASLQLSLYCGDSTIKQTLLLNKLVLSTSRPWPNPSVSGRTSVVHIPYVLNHPSTLYLRVFSIEGNTVYEERVDRSVGEGELRVPTLGLTSGTYHFLIGAEESVMRGQFIVTD